MNPLLLALRELKQTLVQVAFSEAVFETAIVLLSSFIVCIFINLPIYFGFIPGGLYFIHVVNSKFKNLGHSFLSYINWGFISAPSI